MLSIKKSERHQKGFTLVELSIVMIIIGLLIGGILKGQELISNARLASTISQVKAIDAAINTFRDSYAGIPGDVPPDRIPNCLATTVCGDNVIAGGVRNDGRIGVANSAGIVQITNSENIVAWAQLVATDLLGGIRNAPAGANITGGTTVPAADIPGQMYIGYQVGNVAALQFFAGPAASIKSGHYLLIHNAATKFPFSNGASSDTTSLTPVQVSRMDTKLDDATPNNGSVLAMGVAGVGNCTNNGTISGIYNLDIEAPVCGVYILIQQ